jgi:nuclear GTP-binding protein
MGTFKKEQSRRDREGKSKDGLGNVRVKGENFYRLIDPHPTDAPPEC